MKKQPRREPPVPSTHDRRSVVSRFQNDAQCQVLLMTMKTGGVGLNLTQLELEVLLMFTKCVSSLVGMNQILVR